MRKLGIVCAAAGFLTVLGPSAASADPPQDFVTGGGISAVGTLSGFTAHSSPTGANPVGHATLTNAGSQRKGAVTCLRVAGNTAVFGIEDTTTAGETVYRQFYVRDNGEPTGGQPVDELTEVGSATATPQPCADPTTISGGLILRAGNIQVRDAS